MADHDPPIDISVQDVAALQQSGTDFLLLDVRGPDEYATANIQGSTLIPMQELGDRLAEIEDKKDDHIVVHCHHGGRSLQVTQALRSRGFTNVQNMAGGIEVWSQEIDNSVPRY